MPQLLEIVSHPNRQQILQAVWDGERAAGDIARMLPVTFGAVSQHLRLLQDAGVVSVRRDGRHRFYRVNKEALGPLAAYLESLWTSRLDALKSLAEFEDARHRTRKRKAKT